MTPGGPARPDRRGPGGQEDGRGPGLRRVGQVKAFLTAVAILMALVVATALGQLLPGLGRIVDPFLLVVVYCALRGGETQGMLTGLAAGWVQDAQFAGPVLGISPLAQDRHRLHGRAGGHALPARGPGRADPRAPGGVGRGYVPLPVAGRGLRRSGHRSRSPGPAVAGHGERRPRGGALRARRPAAPARGPRVRIYEDLRIVQGRLGILQSMVVGLLALLLIHFWNLQVVRGRYFRAQAENNRTRAVALAAPRGGPPRPKRPRAGGEPAVVQRGADPGAQRGPGRRGGAAQPAPWGSERPWSASGWPGALALPPRGREDGRLARGRGRPRGPPDGAARGQRGRGSPARLPAGFGRGPRPGTGRGDHGAADREPRVRGPGGGSPGGPGGPRVPVQPQPHGARRLSARGRELARGRGRQRRSGSPRSTARASPSPSTARCRRRWSRPSPGARAAPWPSSRRPARSWP